jgi:ferredoxin-NADP reductase
MEPLYMPLTERKEVARDTIQFHFDTTGTGFGFKAGQYVNIGLIDPPFTDIRGNSRSMSVSSSPQDSGFFETAMRITGSAYKRNLSTLPLGTKMKIYGPLGHFILPETTEKPVVFLAGGIGITPMRSMIKYATQTKSDQEIYLFYSNKTKEDTTFLTDLEEFAQENTRFHLLPTLTDEVGKDWKYLHGFIDKKMIINHLPDIHNAIYYTAGPEGMVLAMKEMLHSMNIYPENIVLEQFSGY